MDLLFLIFCSCYYVALNYFSLVCNVLFSGGQSVTVTMAAGGILVVI